MIATSTCHLKSQKSEMFQKRDVLTVYVEGTNKKLVVLRNLHRLGETAVLKFPHLEL